MDSCGHPGKSSMATGTQRLRPSPLTGGSNLEAPSGAAGLGAGVTTGAEGRGGAGTGNEGIGAGKRELGTGSGAAHDTSMPTIDSIPNDFSIPYKRMLLILFEALGAGLLLVLIVWWTMFHGRPSGEREDESGNDK